MTNKIMNDVALRLEYQKGEDEKGNPIIKGQNFNKINLQAEAGDLKAFSDKISEVLNFPVTYVGTQEEYQLLDEI